MQTNPISETGFLRLWQIIGRPATETSPAIPPIVPVSKSTWWIGVRSGRYPKPVKLGPRMTAWKVEDVRALVESISTKPATHEHIQMRDPLEPKGAQ